MPSRLFPGTQGVPEDDEEDDELDEDDDPDELDDDEPDEEDELDEDEPDEVVVPGSVSPQPTAATKLAPSSVKSTAGPVERIRSLRFMVFLEVREASSGQSFTVDFSRALAGLIITRSRLFDPRVLQIVQTQVVVRSQRANVAIELPALFRATFGHMVIVRIVKLLARRCRRTTTSPRSSITTSPSSSAAASASSSAHSTAAAARRRRAARAATAAR